MSHNYTQASERENTDFSSIHLASISPLCAFLPPQQVLTCVTPCSFAFAVCCWYCQSTGVAVLTAYGGKLGRCDLSSKGGGKCAVFVAWSSGRRGIQCRQCGQHSGRCSVLSSMREQKGRCSVGSMRDQKRMCAVQVA